MLNLIRNLFVFFFSLLLLLFSTPPSFANHIPPPTGFVNDFAGVLTVGQKTTLENSLRQYEQESTNEIAIAFVKSLEGGDIDDFTVRVFEEWQIGKKNQDNGILFLAAIEERKMRIEVGYGLEPYLTDGQAGEIIRNVISPEFKKENYYKGVSQGIVAIQNEIAGVEQIPPKQTNNLSILINIKIILLATIYLFIYFAAFLARSKSFWAGGLIGVGLGIIWGYLLAGSILIIIVLVFLFGGIGLVLDWLFSRNYQKAKSSGKPTGFWASWGGFRGGGSGGGFGGGGSGGGGASGSW